MTDEKTIIEFKKLNFSFSNGKELFNDLSLKIKKGTFYLIQGPSGAGKSTFLRLINRLEEPCSGEIFFNGKPLASYAPPLLRRSTLYIQQSPIAVDGSVRQNLLFAFSFKHNRNLTPPDDSVLLRHLENFLMEDISLETNAHTLSLGQLQRLCFIRGLLLKPKVLLLDEPASALDDKSGSIVEHTAERLCAKKDLTVLMVSHRQFKPRMLECSVIKINNDSVEKHQ